MTKGKTYIAIDAGGTSLKWALIRPEELNNSVIRDTLQRVPIDSHGSAETIIATFEKTIEDALRMAGELNLRVSGIGISTPGPFNFEEGIPLMKHKFKAIYGINLRNELVHRLKLEGNLLIRFEHDVEVFLIGETCYGAAQGYNRIIGITLGSGAGSSFMVNGEIIRDGPDIPPEGSIWCLPYGDGIVDDKVSHRGILARYEELGGEPLSSPDVKSISLLALEGDKISLQVFDELGATLGKILKPIVCRFRADCIVLGGQISKSFSLFAGSLKRELQSAKDLKKVSAADLIDLAPLYGVAKRLLDADTF